LRAAAASAHDAAPDLSPESEYLLVYSSSSFADERVCARAKLLRLNNTSNSIRSSGGWCITTEVDLLHPPTKDTSHSDVTCIIGVQVGRGLQLRDAQRPL
jgi:hypothetical protein